MPARFRVCLAAAALSLVTAAIPLAPTAGWASAGISLSIFAVAAFSVNMYTLPLDVFRRRARGLRGLDPGGVLWRGAGGGLAALRQAIDL